MVGKHDPGVDVERRAGADLPNRLPQRVDLCHQQIRPAVQQVHSEEERSARNPIATIIRHDGSMPGFAERRKALRFSALRVLFQHQIHHRGQAHGMLSGTSVPPPQLDEFFSAGEAPLRAVEFAELGWTEEMVWRSKVQTTGSAEK